MIPLTMLVGHDVGAPEAVDRLLGVADHEERARDRAAGAPVGLRRVVRGEQSTTSACSGSVSWNSSTSRCVKRSRKYRAHRGPAAQQPRGAEQQVLEVEHPRLGAQAVVDRRGGAQQRDHRGVAHLAPAGDERAGDLLAEVVPGLDLLLDRPPRAARPVLLDGAVRRSRTPRAPPSGAAVASRSRWRGEPLDLLVARHEPVAAALLREARQQRAHAREVALERLARRHEVAEAHLRRRPLLDVRVARRTPRTPPRGRRGRGRGP